MRARAFWKAVTLDRADFLDRLVALLAEHGIRYCVVGGQAVNAYVEPVVSLDLALAVAADDIPRAGGRASARRTWPISPASCSRPPTHRFNSPVPLTQPVPFQHLEPR